jgi:hypothetical protein
MNDFLTGLIIGLILFPLLSRVLLPEIGAAIGNWQTRR